MGRIQPDYHDHRFIGLSVSLLSSLTSQEQQRSSIESAIGELEGEFVDRSQLGVQPLILEGSNGRGRSHSTSPTRRISTWNPWTWLPVTATLGVSVDNRNKESVAASPRSHRRYRQCGTLRGGVTSTSDGRWTSEPTS